MAGILAQNGLVDSPGLGKAPGLMERVGLRQPILQRVHDTSLRAEPDQINWLAERYRAKGCTGTGGSSWSRLVERRDGPMSLCESGQCTNKGSAMALPRSSDLRSFLTVAEKAVRHRSPA